VIADAIDKVGKDGVVNVEEGQTFGMDLEFTEGMQFDRATSRPTWHRPGPHGSRLEDPYILIANQKIGSVCVTSCRSSSRRFSRASRCLIIAEDVEGESLADPGGQQSCAGTSPAVAVKAPGFGDAASACLRNIAILKPPLR